MGVSEHANIVHLIDFGFSKEFRDPNTHMHIPHKEMISLTETAMFVSIHSHSGIELGRHDDLESLAYVLIYFLRGLLPWQGLSRDLIAKSKQETSTSDLCHGLPVELHALLNYSHSLSFDDKPDYSYLSCLFDDRLLQEASLTAVFNWDLVDSQIDRQQGSGDVHESESPDRRKHNELPKRRTG